MSVWVTEECVECGSDFEREFVERTVAHGSGWASVRSATGFASLCSCPWQE